MSTNENIPRRSLNADAIAAKITVFYRVSDILRYNDVIIYDVIIYDVIIYFGSILERSQVQELKLFKRLSR